MTWTYVEEIDRDCARRGNSARSRSWNIKVEKRLIHRGHKSLSRSNLVEGTTDAIKGARGLL